MNRLARTTVAACVLFLLAGFGPTEPFRARVSRVYDGDTIVVRDYLGHTVTVRLEAIDAPERYQSFAAKSRESLTHLVKYRIVTVVPRTEDTYGRIVGKVLLNDEDVGLEQIRRGFAWHYRYYAEEQDLRDRMSYSDAESEARRARRGLWAEDDPTAPWTFRRWRRRD